MKVINVVRRRRVNTFGRLGRSLRRFGKSPSMTASIPVQPSSNRIKHGYPIFKDLLRSRATSEVSE